MHEINAQNYLQTRRKFLAQSAAGLGGLALSALGGKEIQTLGGSTFFPSYAPKAKHVIFLHQSGGPPQMDLFDYKPHLNKVHSLETPGSLLKGKRLTGMSAGQASFPVARSIFDFKQYGQSGAWVSELMPYFSEIVDDVAIVKSMYTEAINHDPAITFLQTGFQIAGRPSIGAWASYGLGSENENLPAFVAMLSGDGGQPLYDRLWGPGFLPSKHQGVRFRSGKDPVLYLSNPSGMSSGLRKQTLEDLGRLNREHLAAVGDPEIETRIAQYEMAHRMQTSVPELSNLKEEPESTFELYGEDARKPGTYAHNALMARRLVERGTRFVQLYHRGWDTHGGLPKQLKARTKETDQATAGLIKDLKLRGLLDDTLVVWAGEFGRTVYCQGDLSPLNYGRDHHPSCFTIWMAGGGVKPGITYGETDDYSYNVVDGHVSVHDLHATIMHLLGIDHTKLTYKYQGRHFRLTDVHGHVVKDILS